MMMSNNSEKAKIAAVRSKALPSRTRLDELRTLLTQIEKRLTRLDESRAAEALEVLPWLDQAHEQLTQLSAAGGAVESERAQFDSLLRLLRKKDRTWLRKTGAKALQQARDARQPDPDHWWWFVDQLVADERRQTLRRWLLMMGGLVVVLVILGVVYRQFFAPDPNFQAAVGLQQTAENHLLQANYEDALADATASLALWPDPEMLVLQGVLYEILEQPEDAAESFAQARASLPDETDFYNQRARYYLMAGQFDAAFVDLEQALARNPDSAITHLYLGQAYELTGDISKAADYYELAGNLAEAEGDAQLQVIARMNLAQVLQQFALPPTPEAAP